jgi:glutamate--cysteine ligase
MNFPEATATRDNRRPAVPHLTTALTGPLQKLETLLLERQADIEQWFRARWNETPAPFYGSVDLRNAGFKLAPVDTNLFPAGFNNLNPAFQPLSVHAIQAAVERICPTARGVLVIPENHTRNMFYFESLAALIEMLGLAGLQVRVGSLLPDLTAPREIALPSGRRVRLEPLIRVGNKLRVADFEPCFVLLNNDLSAGRPAILENLGQPVVPPLALGWCNRLKSNHFAHYRNIAAEFAELLGIDPWFIDPVFRRCGLIDFQKRDGEECLASNVETVLDTIQKKYHEYGIDQAPFVIVKADAGTYGMAIMTVKDPADVRDLNRKQRTKMAHAKEGQAVTNVIVQEGVYTFETWGTANAVADDAREGGGRATQGAVADDARDGGGTTPGMDDSRDGGGRATSGTAAEAVEPRREQRPRATQGAVAEPVVYMIDHFVVGGFYRVHTSRGPDENLNAPGMQFEPLAFAGPCIYPDRGRMPGASPNRFYAYGVVARLALLAAAREQHEVRENQGRDTRGEEREKTP